ncbi:MAG: penicillin-binding protein 2 [Paracoccaceae bacterium]|nr:penicillin-binding protein 2 [Paracoccaceae bacterium]
MIRSPLRPLIRILAAREKGIDPDIIESEEKVKRLTKKIILEKNRAKQRILLLICMFVLAFSLIGIKMSLLASYVPTHLAKSTNENILDNSRNKITDRNGIVLATNIKTFSLYVHPFELINRQHVARSLSNIFPSLNRDNLVKKFSDGRKFVWIKKSLSPEEREQVKNLGEPGIYFGPREIRLYPNGRFAAHVLGGTTFGREGVRSAELIGQAGVELSFNNHLVDFEHEDLTLTIDVTSQGIIEKVLGGGIKIMNARGGSAILMDVHNGQIISLVSLPDFDPNDRPSLPTHGDPSLSPLFNRAAQGIYELGSTFKIFTAAQVIDEGIVSPNTVLDIKGPIYFGKYKIKDHHFLGEELSVEDIMVKSSNIGTARLAAKVGADRQRKFLKKFGLLDLTGIELPEASRAKPQIPKKWSKLSTATISYGHGISVSPLHLAVAYSAIVNGGKKILPTLIKNSNKNANPRNIISRETSIILQDILKKVVQFGTARNASLNDYSIGGKTGTADKVHHKKAGYHDDKVITTFVATFPMEQPRYVLVVTLDEPEDWSIDKPMRTAGWTAVPVATEIIKRIAPILGIEPNIMVDNINVGASLVEVGN